MSTPKNQLDAKAISKTVGTNSNGDQTTKLTLDQEGGQASAEIHVSSDQSIEIPTQEFSQAIQQEKFMNEYVVVEVAETTNENEPPVIVLNVNGINQPIQRGVPTKMRRMFVEVLARCKETKYSQKTLNPNEPDKIELVPRTGLAYPFQVLEDDNPKGRAWLRAVLTEAA